MNVAFDEIKAEVRVRNRTCVAAEMARDWEAAVAFFAVDAIVQPANAPQIQGPDAILELYETAMVAMSDFECAITDIVPAASADLAYDYGINRLVFATPDGPVEDLGKCLMVWRKIDGEWFISALAFSSDAPPATAVAASG